MQPNEHTPPNDDANNQPAQPPAQPEQTPHPAEQKPAELPPLPPILNPEDDQPSEPLEEHETDQIDAALKLAEEERLDREAVVKDILARLSRGERAMLVFCSQEDVEHLPYSAFPVAAVNGQLVVEPYRDIEDEPDPADFWKK